MRIRVVISGVISGAFCLAALWFPWYMAHPSTITADWAYREQAAALPDWLPTAITVFCGLTIFAFGWVAARWNWSKTRRDSLLAGAGAGLIAGCIIYDLLGAFHFGLMGQEDILRSLSSEVDQIQGLTLLVDGITESANLLYLNFILVIFACVIAGGLGGLASAFDLEDVWGSLPRSPEGWLFRIPAYSLTVTGLGCLIVMIAALTVLEEKTREIAIENNLAGLTTFPTFLLITAYLAALIMILSPMAVTWGWIARSWKNAGWLRILHVFWLVLSAGLTFWLLRGFVSYGGFSFLFDMGPFPYWFVWVTVILSAGMGFLAGYWSPENSASDPKYRASDWLGYALTQGILGGTQLFISVPAYAFVLTLITVVNIPHLTQTEIVDSTSAEQIAQLFGIMSASAQGLILVSAIGGWFLGLIVLGFRKLARVRPAIPKQEPDVNFP